MFRDPQAFDLAVAGMVSPFLGAEITAVAGVESRGFLLGGAAAIRLGVGFIAIRKSGALFPGPKLALTTNPDYRQNNNELLLQRDSVRTGDRVLLVDDWAETGSQARTVRDLIHACGGELVGISLMIDQLDEAARASLPEVTALALFADLPSASADDA